MMNTRITEYDENVNFLNQITAIYVNHIQVSCYKVNINIDDNIPFEINKSWCWCDVFSANFEIPNNEIEIAIKVTTDKPFFFLYT